ncbi:R.CviAI restriction endonuclease [Paramecium bursaria Chlorella virus 1]|uniref:R.CviAI restriction endonuclease n=1 Tax=Paramecium bursaria Chlorella virus 1 TaxID=10506 RepID=O41061_PBCV1|nr:R.CviAI restriction endonuclease [Paramecium bursaria Chlorella virus 1]AAC96930.2 R.CviAI restriction endonuclease [Paramecium bursaria Chlorella virus 1]
MQYNISKITEKAKHTKLPIDGNVIENNIENKIKRIHSKIMKNSDNRVKILKNISVIDWLFGGTMFWKGKSFKTKVEATKFLKKAEDDWGKEMLQKVRPDLKPSGQWTTKLGEHIAEEIFILLGNIRGEIKKVPVMNGLHPDGEADKFMFEAKSQLYYSTGTAAEKILGVPIKYRNVPDLYKKPLKIVCIAGAELRSEEFGIFPGTKEYDNKMREILKFYKQNGIEYVRMTDLLSRLDT